MKTRSLFYMACAALLASCQPNNSYKLTGEIEGAKDGDSIVILTFDNGKLTPTDTLRIENNKFATEGIADSTTFCSYFYHNDETQHQGFFFIEPGNILIKVAEDEKVSGTANNDILQKYSDEMAPISKQMRELYTNYDENADTQIKQLNKQIQDIANRYIKENSDNASSVIIFLFHYTDFSVKENQELIEGMSDTNKNNPIIMQISQALKAKQTSEPGNQISDFTLTDINGDELTLSQVVKENKLTLLDCWASWCGPCMGEMPNVVKVYEQYHNQGFEVVGISFDKDESSWKNAIEKMGMTWRQASELNGWDNKVKELYGIDGIPFTLLIDQNGTIIAKNLRDENLAETVAAQLNK
ncbi:MAG: AhpC/TSA family protein [Clostridium sp.]|nr:AhpC/TSA family protein [Clostridium sp.]